MHKKHNHLILCRQESLIRSRVQNLNQNQNLNLNLNQLLFLPSLKLLSFAFNGLDEQRQTGVHRFLCRRSVRVILLLHPSSFLFTGDRLRLLRTEDVLHPPLLLLLSSALLLGQEALGALGLLVAGVGRVQVEEVGGEHGLETRIFDVHLDTDTRVTSCSGSAQVKSAWETSRIHQC